MSDAATATAAYPTVHGEREGGGERERDFNEVFNNKKGKFESKQLKYKKGL